MESFLSSFRFKPSRNTFFFLLLFLQFLISHGMFSVFFPSVSNFHEMRGTAGFTQVIIITLTYDFHYSLIRHVLVVVPLPYALRLLLVEEIVLHT